MAGESVHSFIIAAVVMMTVCSVCGHGQVQISPVKRIPVCTDNNLKSKRVSIGGLQYWVPKVAIVKKVKDVDYAEQRVFLKRSGGVFLLKLGWQVNNPSSLSQCRATTPEECQERSVVLPDGSIGSDARGIGVIEGNQQKWRNLYVAASFAIYEKVPTDVATDLDAIIDSVCYQRR
jgi:hypothetical protein